MSPLKVGEMGLFSDKASLFRAHNSVFTLYMDLNEVKCVCFIMHLVLEK